MRIFVCIGLILSSMFGMGQDYLSAFLNQFSEEWNSNNEQFDFSRNGLVDISDAVSFITDFENDRVVFDGSTPVNPTPNNNGMVYIQANNVNGEQPLIALQVLDENDNPVSTGEVNYEEFANNPLIYSNIAGYVPFFYYGDPTATPGFQKQGEQRELILATIVLIGGIATLAYAQVQYIQNAYQVQTFYMTDWMEEGTDDDGSYYLYCKDFEQIGELIAARVGGALNLASVITVFATAGGSSVLELSDQALSWSAESWRDNLIEAAVNEWAVTANELQNGRKVTVKVYYDGVDNGFEAMYATYKLELENPICAESDLVSLEISGPSQVYQNQTQAFTATGHYQDGSTFDLTRSVDWTVTPSSAGSFDNNGNFTAESGFLGSCDIQASYEGTVSNLLFVDILESPIEGNMILVNAGTFTQGTDTDPCYESNETPFSHTLTRNILVMETEVSRQMWADLKAVQSTLPNDPTNTSYGSGMNNPVQNNTWYEAVLFANLLSVERGLTRCYYKDESYTTPVDSTNYTSGSFYCNFDANGYRLPSEGEWEYFTRAGTTGPFSIDEPNYNSSTCGSSSCTTGTLPNLESVAVFCGNDAGQSEPVGSKDPNPWGLKDVHGNVWEWCWDWYSSYPSGSATDYEGATSGSSRVLRGGSWFHYARYCRSAYRSMSTPSNRYYIRGFRLVRTYP